jgi:hypothetical protein
VELRELIGQLALVEGRKVVVFSQRRRMLRLAHWATRNQLAREGAKPAFFTCEQGQKRRTQNRGTSTTTPPAACSSRSMPATSASTCNEPRAPASMSSYPGTLRLLEQRIGRIHRFGATPGTVSIFSRIIWVATCSAPRINVDRVRLLVR